MDEIEIFGHSGIAVVAGPSGTDSELDELLAACQCNHQAYMSQAYLEPVHDTNFGDGCTESAFGSSIDAGRDECPAIRGAVDGNFAFASVFVFDQIFPIKGGVS